MKNKMILLTTDRFGTGDDALGTAVLESYFAVVKSRPGLPAVIFCANRGVLALTRKSLASLHIGELEKAGVRVLACKTCVDFYDVEEQLLTGTVSSMGDFVDLSAEHEVVTIA